MSGGYCTYCCAQTAWETDRNTGATYCTQCYMQPRVEHDTPQCVNCGSRAGYYEDHQRGARYCRYCRQMMDAHSSRNRQATTMPHDPRYENDPLQGLTCPYCARGDEIYNTTEAGGYQQTMCRRCKRPIPNASTMTKSDVRVAVDPNLFRVYDEFDPIRMRQRYENVQPPLASATPPQLGRVPQQAQPLPSQVPQARSSPSAVPQPAQPSPPVATCSNCHTGAYVARNPSTGVLQCTRCGQWVARSRPTPPPAAPKTAFAPTLESNVCPDCGVRGVMVHGSSAVHCPQCRRRLHQGSPKQGLQHIQSLFDPGSPERLPQPNRIGHRDDDVFGF